MSTIAEKLTQLNQVKANIKLAIEAKGVSDVGVNFTLYPDKIASIPQTVSVTKTKLHNGIRFVESQAVNPDDFDWSELTELTQMFQRCSTAFGNALPNFTNVFTQCGSNVTNISGFLWQTSTNGKTDLANSGFGLITDCQYWQNCFSGNTTATEYVIPANFASRSSRSGVSLNLQNLFRDNAALRVLDINNFWAWNKYTEGDNISVMLDRFCSDCPALTDFIATNVNFKGIGFEYWDVGHWNIWMNCPNLVNLKLCSGFFEGPSGPAQSRDFSTTGYVPTAKLYEWLQGVSAVQEGATLYFNSSQVATLNSTPVSDTTLYNAIAALGWTIQAV